MIRQQIHWGRGHRGRNLELHTHLRLTHDTALPRIDRRGGGRAVPTRRAVGPSSSASGPKACLVDGGQTAPRWSRQLNTSTQRRGGKVRANAEIAEQMGMTS